MADKVFLCIIGEMDRLWFHQVILFSEPTASVPSLSPPPDEAKAVSILESVFCSTSVLSSPLPPDDETSTDESNSSEKQLSSDSISVPLQDNSTSTNNEEEIMERLARMNILGSRTRSHSSSPSTQNRRRRFRKPAACTRKLQKSMSCRTLGELELDEVKGFMDLGFIFKKENLSPRMMNVVPGLQRLNKQPMEATKWVQVQGNDTVEEEEKRDIMRPYLSEAWLIKRPDSQLLNLKIPKHCSTANMKKHLRFWAKTVASEIHQD
ncbi:hypothetical protein VNO77_17604 [Canavalia gladiata]|uniref:Uncharacterized protein n=1 Tax=Canavalia gladiata TaxID=3824 RepID=A0AAN9LK08_CANGL